MSTRIETRLDDVTIEKSDTDETLYAKRQAAWLIDTAEKEVKHRRRFQEDIDEDAKRPKKPLPGRRGGRRVRLVWRGTPSLRAWRTKFRGLPGIKRRFHLNIRGCQYEFPATHDEDGNELTAAKGRRFTEVYLSRPEQHWMKMHGVRICNPGTFDNLTIDSGI